MEQRRALISVYDKHGLDEFARSLWKLGFEILSTGGTARAVQAAGVPVVEVSAYTGFPELLDGRVKTLHPAIHAGILARPIEEHRAELKLRGIGEIDVVVVNLYPFRETMLRPNVSEMEVIENIDIGGPSLLRAAAKNFERVLVVVDPADYASVAQALEQPSLATEVLRRALARKAFARISAYDAEISNWLSGTAREVDLPESLTFCWDRAQALRYGENPHQMAALYRDSRVTIGSLVNAKQLAGKQLSYNNLLDADATLALLRDLEGPAACIVKHNNPCGVGVAETGIAAFQRAFASDPTSAFGGIVGITEVVDAELAQALLEPFLEVVLAPAFTAHALGILAAKKNLRLMQIEPISRVAKIELRSVAGGVLVQTSDDLAATVAQSRTVSRRAVATAEAEDLNLAWRVCKHVKSNAIVLAKGGATVGIGAGQMSRVDSVRIAVEKAGDRAAGAAMASDAFFPFRDSIDVAARAGVKAVIHPGGSVRDAEVIAAADEYGLAMVMTGERHFRH